MKPGTKFMLGLGVLIAVAWVWSIVSHSYPAPAPVVIRTLQLDVGRGPLGITLVNREPGPVENCSVLITDAQGIAWMLNGHRRITPLASATVEYEELRAQGEPLQPFVGRALPVTIACDLVDENSRASGTWR